MTKVENHTTKVENPPSPPASNEHGAPRPDCSRPAIRGRMGRQIGDKPARTGRTTYLQRADEAQTAEFDAQVAP